MTQWILMVWHLGESFNFIPSLFILVFAVVNLSYQDHWPRFSGTLINLAEDVLGKVLLTRHARLWRRHIKCQRVRGSNPMKPFKKDYSGLENYTEKVWKQKSIKVLLTNSCFKKKNCSSKFSSRFCQRHHCLPCCLESLIGLHLKKRVHKHTHPVVTNMTMDTSDTRYINDINDTSSFFQSRPGVQSPTAHKQSDALPFPWAFLLQWTWLPNIEARDQRPITHKTHRIS